MKQYRNDLGKHRIKTAELYLYTDQYSYEPLARIDRNGNQEQHIYYFHTDLNGMPEEMTDEAGEIVWEYSYQLWSKPIQEIAHREIQQTWGIRDSI